MKKERTLMHSVKSVLMSALLILYIIPFLLVIVNSFKERAAIIKNPIALPTALQFVNFQKAFAKMNFLSSITNSIVITLLSVLIIVFFSSMTAYYFVRVKTKFNNFMLILMVSSMIIPFQGIMIPLVSIYGKMGLLNSRGTLIFMYLGFGTSLAVFMFHGFIKNIPLSLEEAAMIDGATRFKTFKIIVLPLLKPITMTIVILDVLWIWNDFLLPSLILMRADLRTLPLSTFFFFGTYTVDYNFLMAGLVLSMIPLIILYLFLQKHVISGVLQGSIK
jgi:raffinose/stachyose/melibiose transport system permease protein